MDDRRIQQFRQMTEADPNNELGHFSLGKALLDAGMPREAIEPFERAISLRPTMSKAYQLLGEAHEKAGDHAKAVEIVTKGVSVADELGDIMPRDTMVNLLSGWGSPVPTLKTAGRASSASPEAGAAAPGFTCARCGQPSGKLPKPPFKGPVGAKIFDRVCSTCWHEWIGMGTKVINELALQLNTAHGQETYDQYMLEFLQLNEH